ncbi:response regulator [Pseudoduganella sp. DS3]|uniref:histidine kinase n=1 Tax=Pseudoduganella guangdongensis TaxID=2692179 RepID=A0A6N9HNU3_9BURK|nr:response regulator [Pseudoduganella guangdongensis]
MDKPKILVVNDDANSLFALTNLLGQWAAQEGYEVVAARSGEDALREVLMHDFAVILLDVNMPGMDGFETAEAIHQRPRSADIPIIFITAFVADELDRLKAYQRGAVDFLFTPVIPQMLYAKISVFVALATKNEELRRQARQLSQRTTDLIASNQRLLREIEERKTAERASHAKDEFLAMLGHELRNPLSAISSAASLIGLPGVPADSVGHAKKIIQRQSRHLGRIVDDLLDLSRAMSGKILLNRAPLDLAALLNTALETFHATGRLADYDLRADIAPCWVHGDATRLEQVFCNLLDNALKYTAPGGRIEVICDVDDDELTLSIHDSGVGIPAELLPQVFDVFVQGTSTLDRAQGGLGIGLALVRRLVELHGGTVLADSAGPGEGSTFTVHLPCIEHVNESKVPLMETSEQSKPAVLLVEDNDDGREMMAMMLSCYGYPVQHAADGFQGLATAAAARPDIALVDIGLPGIDGYEVARRMRANPDTHHIKLIALTGYGLADDQRRVMDAGFDMHLVKPVDVDQLLRAITECLASSPAAVRT